MASFDEEIMADPDDAEKNKVMGIIAYFGCLFFIPLISAKDSSFAKYHANQGLMLFLTYLALWAVNSFVLSLIPVINWFSWMLYFGILGLMIIGIINAAGGKMKPLPLIGGVTLLK